MLQARWITDTLVITNCFLVHVCFGMCFIICSAVRCVECVSKVRTTSTCHWCFHFLWRVTCRLVFKSAGFCYCHHSMCCQFDWKWKGCFDLAFNTDSSLQELLFSEQTANVKIPGSLKKNETASPIISRKCHLTFK